MKKLFVIFGILLVTLLSSHLTFAAGTAGYQPLTPIPGLTSSITTGTSAGQSGIGFSGYLRALYVWGVAAASGLAVLMIMWGGVEYMTSAGGGGVEEAKKRISAAVTGLLLALGSYIILYTINRDLLNLQFQIGTVNAVVNGNATVKIIPQTTRAQIEARQGAIGSDVNNSQTQSTQTTKTKPSASDPSNAGIGADVNLPTPEPIAPTTPSNDAPNPLLPPLNQEKTTLPGQK